MELVALKRFIGKSSGSTRLGKDSQEVKVFEILRLAIYRIPFILCHCHVLCITSYKFVFCHYRLPSVPSQIHFMPLYGAVIEPGTEFEMSSEVGFSPQRSRENTNCGI